MRAAIEKLFDGRHDSAGGFEPVAFHEKPIAAVGAARARKI